MPNRCRVSVVVALCALFQLYAHSSTAAAERCGLTRITSLDLAIFPNDWVYVPVTLNGHSGFLQLQLNSPLSFLYQSAVDEAGLETRSSGGKVQQGKATENRVAVYDSLSLGTAPFGGGRLLLAADTAELQRRNNLPVFGSLGTELFSHFDFELDLSHRKLTLYSQDHCKGKVVYWAKAWGSAPLLRNRLGVLYFPVELEHKKLNASFAPSQPLTVLSTDVTRQLYGFDETSPGVTTQPPQAGEASASHYRAMSLTASDMQVRNTRIRLVPPPPLGRAKTCSLRMSASTGAVGYADCEGIFPMQLGRNVLESLRLYFATRENVVYFTVAGATSEVPSEPQEALFQPAG
jgi:hypothetical protein